MKLENIEKKIYMIKEYIGIIDELKPDCLKRIRTDKIYRGSVLYYLYILSDSCISLAEMVIKHESLPKPQTYFEAIDMLGEHNIIPSDFAFEFAKITGLRNFLAHDYEKVDYEEICKLMIEKIDDINKYLFFIEKHLNKS
ncbi:MAG: DUF86 domain-containing protein [Actinomycetia bacterium]|nr:DUF86 domain-containing protein [Actinomycetes bacterium]